MRPVLFASLFVISLASLASISMSHVAHADEPAPAPVATAWNDTREPKPPIAASLSSAQTTYFLGERAQGYGWGGVGVVAMGAGAALFADNHPFTRGASYPIFIVGAAQTFIAVLSFVRPGGRIARNDEAIKKDPHAWLEEERARMHTVNRFLTGVKILEVATIVTGLALTGAGLLGHDQSMEGVGVGVSAQGALMFVLDTFAHERAEGYESILLRPSFGPISPASP